MPKPLKIEVPTQGWRQFLSARKELLDAFDSARAKSRTQEVQVHHGHVAEAGFRKWLLTFLPRRYGVTPGYIVSTGLKSGQPTPHFDVIIYDQLESPVLWVESSPDASAQGTSLAIPVEHVRCVLEVKSRLDPGTATKAISHLSDLVPLLGGVDPPHERYKLHLPPGFRCGTVFYDLDEDSIHSEAALSNLLPGIELRGFFGGVVLRSTTHERDLTGRIFPFESDTPIKSSVKQGRGLLSLAMSDSIQLSADRHIGMILQWSEHDFAAFAFDILAMMEGTYEIGRLSSFYGFGGSQMEDSTGGSDPWEGTGP